MQTVREAILRVDLTQQMPATIRMRGTTYFNQSRVTLEMETNAEIWLTVRGTYDYTVAFTLFDNGVVIDCDCPYFMDHSSCKHIAAAVMFLQAQGNRPDSGWKNRIERVLTLNRVDPRYIQNNRFLIVLSLQKETVGQYAIESYALAEKHLPSGLVDAEGYFEMADVLAVLDAQPELQKKLTPISGTHSAERCLNEHGATALALLQTSDYRYAYYRRQINTEGLLPLGLPLFLGQQEFPLAKLIHYSADHADVQLYMSQPEGFLQLAPQLVWQGDTYPMESKTIALLNIEKPHALIDGHLVSFSAEKAISAVRQLTGGKPLVIPTSEEAEFFDEFFIGLHQLVPIQSAQEIWHEVTDAAPQKALHLSEEGNKIAAQLMFHYGGFAVPYQANSEAQAYRPIVDQVETDARYAVINRDLVHEAEIFKTVSNSRYGLKYGKPDGKFTLRSAVDAVDFLLKKTPNLLEDEWLVIGEQLLKQTKVNRNTPTVSLNVSSGIDWFDVEAMVKFGDVSADWKSLRQALRKKQSYVKLNDGSIGEITPELLAKLDHLLNLGEQSAENDSMFRLQSAQLTLIDQLCQEADESAVDDFFTERLERLRSFAEIEPRPLSPHFVGELRPYQKTGVDWLHFLHEFDFGGCLADDMGLGKTVQVLAFLQALHHADPARSPALIVVPRSLLHNWEREAARFTPDLKTHLQFGPSRKKSAEAVTQFDQHQIVLTTYGTLCRDIEWIRTYPFSYVILDESQAIKNAASQSAKAVRLLTSGHRLTMTGTPVENTTLELWAQFSFLNPGLLGSLTYFKRRFSLPIERGQDEEAAELLQRIVYPFLLRRTKEEVAPELPPRTEQIFYNEMLPAQQRLYERTRNELREKLLASVQQDGINKSQFQVLTGLLRLRQISNHPRLVKPDFSGSSSKMESLLEIMQTLKDEGHQALVFSQFTQMLTLVRAEMEVREWSYLYLDGQTSKRQERVDQFQSDPDIPFFLISLKAGGTGLNLTAASYVIHIDPWWNPAVEMQATDRAHRIGQDKPVFVCKLITRGTVEEKILALQERKRELVNKVVATDSGFLKSLSAEDIDILFT